MTVQKDRDHRAEDRLDLIKRLFAVAISLGIGSTIVNASWIREGTWPSKFQFEQIAIVSLALFATVLSWDGYLASVRKKPLYDLPRFAIDVLLVFIYTILIVTSDKSWFWLPILCLIYTLYVAWDMLSVIQFPLKFDRAAEDGKRSRVDLLMDVYCCALLDREGIERGPLTSLVWALYFFGLLGIYWKIYVTFDVIPAVFSGAAGLAGYRADKRMVRGGVRGFTMIERSLLILSLFAVVIIYAHLRGIPLAV